MVDKKILDFQKKNPNLIGHNLYYAITVNEDDTIAEERYGANLLTNRGFRQKYYSSTSGPDNGQLGSNLHESNPYYYQDTWLLIGTGYTNDNGATYTGAPKLTDQCMDEFAARASECTRSDMLSIIETGYDDRNTMDNGFIYLNARVGRAMFNYQQELVATSVTGHTGGTPDSETIDTRWQQDPSDGSWYFNITEIGGCLGSWRSGSGGSQLFTTDDMYFQCYTSTGWNSYWCNSLYPAENRNTQDFSKKNLAYHFLLVDDNNTPAPIKKRQNQKLYIYTYITLVAPEKLIMDLWKDKKYLLLNPQGYNNGNNRNNVAVYIAPVSGNMRAKAWSNQNPITNFWHDDGYSYSYLNMYGSFYEHKLTEEGEGYPWDNNPYGTDDGVSITYQLKTSRRLMEDKWCFISHFVFGDTYSGDMYPNNTNYTTDFSKWCWLTTFDELDEADEITTEIYCNTTIDLNISDQFGLVADTSYKNGLMPITCVENPSSITKAYLFNYDTKECDIPIDITIPAYYYGGWRTFIENIILNNFICPDGVKRDILCYFNPFAHKDGDTDYDGIHPGMIISSFNVTGIILFAADKYWDTSTWIQFVNLGDVSTQEDPSNHQLLVQKKYFVMYAPSELKKRIIDVTFKEECLPKVIPQTDVTYLTKHNDTTDEDDALTITNHDIIEMIGDDEYKYFTIGNYVIKMKGEPGRGSQNTLECDKQYFIQHDKLFVSLYHSRIANGKNIVYRLSPFNKVASYNTLCQFITFQDITQESIIPGYGNTCGSLKNHFFGPKYPTVDAYEDHNHRFMILSTNSISTSTEYFDEEGNALTNYPACITIFDTNIDAETQYPTTESNIKLMLECKYADSTEWRAVCNNDHDYYYNYQWIMKDEEYLEIEQGDCVMFFTQFYSEYSPSGGNEWCGIVYDENHNILHNISIRYTPYVITHPDAKYMKVAMVKYRGMDTTIRDVWYTNNKNYGSDAPCIKNAKHGIVIKGSSNKMIYNDISEGVELQHWNVIDMTDPIDGNGDPKVIDSFEIDPNFIGGTYSGGIGFSHYAYIGMNDKNNIYSFWMYDLNERTLTQLLETWGGFNDSTTNRHACFVANDDVLCYCGAVNSNSITNDSFNYGSAIYCITKDDPSTVHTLYGYSSCFTSLQLKTVNWGTSENPKNQLLLAAYGYNTNGTNYTTRPKIVLDIGKWLQTKSWEDGEPDGFFNTGNVGNTGANVYCYIYDKGVIGLRDGKSSAQTSQLGYRPLENYLPMQITVQSKTINSFNNPLQINEKTYTLTRSNNLEHLGYGIN